MMNAVASVFGRRVARDPSTAPGVLTPTQVRVLGALLLAAQIPQAPHLPIWAAVAGITLVGVRLALLRSDRLRPGSPPARIPSWALVIFAVVAAFAVRGSFGYFVGRDPSVAFLYILVAIKLLETRSTRDGMLLVCLACFLLLTPFFYSQSLFAALAALPAVVLVGVALDVLHRPPASLANAGFAWRPAARRSAVMMLQGLPIAVLLFVLFPRLAGPLWGLPSDFGAQSGLSDSMAPGQISELSLSDAVAFRVDFDGAVPAAPTRYWRGPVFSRFDGRTWRPGAPGPRGEFVAAGTPVVTYTVSLEPNNRPSLFALDLPAALPSLATAGDASRATAILTADQQLLLRAPVTQLLRYTQVSALRSAYPADPATESRANLGLGTGNPRAIAYARELRQQFPDNADYVRAILRWFNQENFVYTLAPPFLDRDPVDLFLFEERRGFCEHYASAFVLLMRAGGIPARVVTGYQGGTINPRGGYLIVRQSDAHAWAEALLNGQWQRIDPTAAVAPSRVEMGLGAALPSSNLVPFLARIEFNWIKSVQLGWDAFNHDWRRNVVGFNKERQRSLWREWNLDQVEPWQLVAILALLLFAWAGLVVGWLMWKRRRQERALMLWHDLNKRLTRAGLPRYPHEGPLAFAQRACARWPQFTIAFTAIGESFAELRYGPVRAAPERTALVATLERAIEVLPAAATLRAAG